MVRNILCDLPHCTICCNSCVPYAFPEDPRLGQDTPSCRNGSSPCATLLYAVCGPINSGRPKLASLAWGPGARQEEVYTPQSHCVVFRGGVWGVGLHPLFSPTKRIILGVRHPNEVEQTMTNHVESQ